MYKRQVKARDQSEEPEDRCRKYRHLQRVARFFRIGLSHNSLEAFFEINFALMHHHKYSLSEIEAMLPWERDVYVSLLIRYVKEENERKIKEQNKIKG